MRRVDAPLILTRIYSEVSNQSVGFCSMFLLSRRVCVRWWIIWWGGNVSLVRMLVFRLTESLWTLDNHVSVSARKANSRADRRHKFTRMSTPRARKGISVLQLKLYRNCIGDAGTLSRCTTLASHSLVSRSLVMSFHISSSRHQCF